MSGTSFGGGDSPLVRLGFTSTRPEADPAASAQAPSEEVPLLLAKMGQSYDQYVRADTIEEDSTKKGNVHQRSTIAAYLL